MVRHPSLILHALEGQPELAVLHTKLELSRARDLYARLSERLESAQPGDETQYLRTAVRLFKEKICYKNAALYALCRLFSPDIAVETGVHYGASSAFILQALADNGKGHLYSIDLPNASYKLNGSSSTHSDLLPEGRTTGFVVPTDLRNRWTLILGNAKEELPALAESLQFIDMFHHDSLHTYEHMIFEYQTVWKKLRPGGLLTSDDVTWNSAFSDFCSAAQLRHFIVEEMGLAVIR